LEATLLLLQQQWGYQGWQLWLLKGLHCGVLLP
jgi:hypothetical protein